MQIYPVGYNSSYPKRTHQPSYKGIVKNSAELQNSLSAASNYGVYKFLKLLRKMIKIDDGKTYNLTTIKNRDSRRLHEYYKINLECKDRNGEITKSINIVTQKDENIDKKSPLYKQVLTKINSILEEDYAQQNPNENFNLREAHLKTINDVFLNG